MVDTIELEDAMGLLGVTAGAGGITITPTNANALNLFGFENGAGAGRAVNVAGGTGTTSGGGVVVEGGFGDAAPGGSITINGGGSGTALQSGGSVTISGGEPGAGGDYGNVIINNLPTSNPGVAGALYITAGALMVSAG